MGNMRTTVAVPGESAGLATSAASPDTGCLDAPHGMTMSPPSGSQVRFATQVRFAAVPLVGSTGHSAEGISNTGGAEGISNTAAAGHSAEGISNTGGAEGI